MADEIGRAAGRPVRYAPVGLDEFRELLTPHVGPAQAEMFVQLGAEIFDGRNEKVGDGVQQALGREPRDFTAFGRGRGDRGVVLVTVLWPRLVLACGHLLRPSR